MAVATLITEFLMLISVTHVRGIGSGRERVDSIISPWFIPGNDVH